jgi:replicative DNA helicase
LTEFQPYRQPAEHVLGRPQDIESEQIVLGSILHDATIYDQVRDVLTSRDFLRDWHGYIWDAIGEIYRSGGTPTKDAIVRLLVRHLGCAEWEQKIEQYVSSIYGRVAAPSNAVFYARFVADDAVRRRLCEVAPLIPSAANDYSITTAEVRERVNALVASTDGVQDESRSAHMSDLAYEVLGQVLEDAENGRRRRGADTGLSDLDYTLSGLTDDVILIAARTSVGKSALALRICETFCKRDEHGIYFSLEMSKADLTERWASMHTRIPYTLIRNRSLTPAHRQELREAMEFLAGWNLHIEEKAGITPEFVRSRCRAASRTKALSLIVVDHLHIMAPAMKTGDDVKDLREITVALHNLAREYRCPVLLLAQLNRGPEKRPDSVPRMDDIRGSGSIEENADTIIAIHRPNKKKDRIDTSAASEAAGDDCEEAELHIIKNRNGPAGGFVSVVYKADCVRFDNCAADARGYGREAVPVPAPLATTAQPPLSVLSTLPPDGDPFAPEPGDPDFKRAPDAFAMGGWNEYAGNPNA